MTPNEIADQFIDSAKDDYPKAHHNVVLTVALVRACNEIMVYRLLDDLICEAAEGKLDTLVGETAQNRAGEAQGSGDTEVPRTVLTEQGDPFSQAVSGPMEVPDTEPPSKGFYPEFTESREDYPTILCPHCCNPATPMPENKNEGRGYLVYRCTANCFSGWETAVPIYREVDSSGIKCPNCGDYMVLRSSMGDPYRTCRDCGVVEDVP